MSNLLEALDADIKATEDRLARLQAMREQAAELSGVAIVPARGTRAKATPKMKSTRGKASSAGVGSDIKPGSMKAIRLERTEKAKAYLEKHAEASTVELAEHLRCSQPTAKSIRDELGL